MKKTVIGVTPLFDDERNSIWMIPGYMDMLTSCGALPIILPFDNGSINEMLEICSGFLFTGGHDLAPALYSEEPIVQCGKVCPKKDNIERQIFEAAYTNDIPVFGICRGIQFINVMLGGTLYQDIPTQMDISISHKMIPPYDRKWHNVNIINNTPLYNLLKTDLLAVNSYHHQGIKSLSQKVLPMAYSEDGLVEAIYCPDKKYIWAVQWHPELSWKNDKAQYRIIENFVEHCK